MRLTIGHHRTSKAKPAASLPHYHQYHLENPGTDVLIAAWQCPVAAPTNVDATWFQRNCTLPLEHVDFDVTDHLSSKASAPPALPPPLGPNPADLQIAAHPATGYATDSRAMCEIVAPGDEHAPGSPPAIRCNWYTWQRMPAEITVYAWECTDGYDFASELANPMEDCIGMSNEVHYQLTNGQPEHGRQAHTSAGHPGAARFHDLEPGEYTLAETVNPESEHDTILWQCFGIQGEGGHSAAKPATDVSFPITGGEHITCHRFHIP